MLEYKLFPAVGTIVEFEDNLFKCIEVNEGIVGWKTNCECCGSAFVFSMTNGNFRPKKLCQKHNRVEVTSKMFRNAPLNPIVGRQEIRFRNGKRIG
ncbi:hypothetical protein RQ765_01875 [Roseomonas mucosa]|uniref:hypothetical protein n=1 Tax=Roseomonas mucosa TaxID=207340 RepID=UPI00123B4647|nr:hypothetical protein [Roseomonas mucosa]MDT8261701.1 hypothetical protein [Roseomonas sp. DSM 102946]MDT8312474.1 hypothetical protein [Roseomonas mucosa]MDT8359067.1 hypothetical protein [Roseomonas mucosa]QET93405.1 hypothetical protein FOB66_11720 [Roseomonas mucosa]